MKPIVRFMSLLAAVFLVVLVGVTLFTSIFPAKADGDNVSSSSPSTRAARAPDQELRAVWVSFYSLTVKPANRSEQGFRNQFQAVVDRAKGYGFNTLVVHVRSHADAMYPSKLYPWSHLLTGAQGVDPDYDPLACMIEITHKAGLSFHAWLNPLRIQHGTTPQTLSTGSLPARFSGDSNTDNDRWAVQIADGTYLNPAYPGARAYIIDGVKEIVQNYDVDGVHFDDYFYPVGPEGENTFDKPEYDKYCETASPALSLLDWRTENINALVSGVYSAVKAEKADVVFGISPAANFENDRLMAADVKTWGSKKGYVDYLCPQIYFSFTHNTHPYEQTAQEWAQVVKSPEVALYVGLGLYKAGTQVEKEPEWAQAHDIIARQIAYGRDTLHWDGFMVFSYADLTNPEAALECKAMKQVIKKKS